jgi:hypothetical protein
MFDTQVAICYKIEPLQMVYYTLETANTSEMKCLKVQ